MFTNRFPQGVVALLPLRPLGDFSHTATPMKCNEDDMTPSSVWKMAKDYGSASRRAAWLISPLSTMTAVLTLVAPAGALILTTPAGAQSVSKEYRAYTVVTRGGVNAGKVASGSYDLGQPTPTTPQYTVQEGGGGWRVGASSDDTHGGTVTASAAISYVSPLGATYIDDLAAHSQLDYIFTLDGPDSNALIPVLVNAVGSASGNSLYGSTIAGFSLSTLTWHDPNDYFRIDAYTAISAPSSSFDVDQLVYLKVGLTYDLRLSAVAEVGRGSVRPDYHFAEAIAQVDPTFTIQGDFAKDYYFVGLPASAIGGVAAVPEPASWAMMVVGFGLVGSAVRRRRTSVHVA